ncbi:MAG: PD-(D/E)XK nuclease domain-containing protein [Treponema sp.]|jgi:hypothetical protein|nr:PD-(D/E)XK nuclease domain-containing protein [Treponema sp.]
MINKEKRPVRFFNTTGPCNPWDHYMLPPEERLVGAQLHRYIRDQLYWVLHAPRQTGKTTFLQNWMREINSGRFNGGDAVACYVSVERCQGLAEAAKAMPNICKAIQEYAEFLSMPVPELKTGAVNSMLSDILINWSVLVVPKPLVVLFDETDVLEGETLISFLRQLRGGFAGRGPGFFPVSIALVGMRDLKDYITAAKGGATPNPGSPFNVKSDSAMLSNFLREDIAKLFAQRTEETGQEISGEALDYVYDQSRGQPWIVNSLFQRATMRILDEGSRETVSLEHIMEAREQMILARETHLDALEVRLRDPQIRRLVESIIIGAADPGINRASPDVQLAMDLGLVSWTTETGFIIANPIYADILTRYLNAGYHDNLPPPSTWQWQKADGSLDMDALLREFQRFWRENSEVWEEKSDYTEAFPHLLLMAFLQRVLNGGGRIDREYAAGRGRMDLYVEYKGGRYIIEVKLIHDRQSPEQVTARGLEQIAKYRDSKAPDAPAYLLIFDRRPRVKEAPWEERLGWTREGSVTVVRS